MTAVEFLEKELYERFHLSYLVLFNELIQQAKEIEKEQHNETWDSAHQAGRFEGKGIAEENWQTFETYWDETFKSE